MFAIRNLRNASNQKKILFRYMSCSCQRVYCTEAGSVMRHVTSGPPSNKDCTIKGKQLYNVLLDMKGCPSLVNMQCLRVCAIILQFETLLSGSGYLCTIICSCGATIHVSLLWPYSVPHIHTSGCALALAHQSLNQLL